MDTVFKALADPTRREILRLLGQGGGGEMTAGQLSERFGISGPSMSHHFNVLKGADLISARRDGQQILYSLNTTVFQDVLSVVFDLFGRDGQGSGEAGKVMDAGGARSAGGAKPSGAKQGEKQ